MKLFEHTQVKPTRNKTHGASHRESFKGHFWTKSDSYTASKSYLWVWSVGKIYVLKIVLNQEKTVVTWNI